MSYIVSLVRKDLYNMWYQKTSLYTAAKLTHLKTFHIKTIQWRGKDVCYDIFCARKLFAASPWQEIQPLLTFIRNTLKKKRWTCLVWKHERKTYVSNLAEFLEPEKAITVKVKQFITIIPGKFFLNIPDLTVSQQCPCFLTLKLKNRCVLYHATDRRHMQQQLVKTFMDRRVTIVTTGLLRREWEELSKNFHVVTVKQWTRMLCHVEIGTNSLTNVLKDPQSTPIQEPHSTCIIDCSVFAQASEFERNTLCAVPCFKIILIEQSLASCPRILSNDMLPVLINSMPYSSKLIANQVAYPALISRLIHRGCFHFKKSSVSSPKECTLHIHKVNCSDGFLSTSMKQLNDFGSRFPTQYSQPCPSANLCFICRENENVCTIQPCRHEICLDCVNQVQNCPFCRTSIEEVSTSKELPPNHAKLLMLFQLLKSNETHKTVVVCNFPNVSRQLLKYLEYSERFMGRASILRSGSKKIELGSSDVVILSFNSLVGLRIEAERVVLWHPVLLPNAHRQIQNHVTCTSLHHFIYKNTIEDES